MSTKSTFKYFDAHNNEVDAKRVSPVLASKIGKVRGDGVKAVWTDSFSVWAFRPEGVSIWDDAARIPVARVIQYKNNPSLHKCGGKCRSAKGGTCECECGGKFHGCSAAL